MIAGLKINTIIHVNRLNGPPARLSADGLTVFIGMHDRSATQEHGGQKIKVATTEFKREFNPDTEHADIAILTLANPAELGEFVNVVCLTNQPAHENSQCFATGYGVKDEKGQGEITLKKVMEFSLAMAAS